MVGRAALRRARHRDQLLARLVDAGKAIGLTPWQRFLYVRAPMMFRIVLPSLSNVYVSLFKDTSLASVVGFVELTRASQVINNSLFQPFLVFGLAGCLYFALCYPLSRWSRRLERKLNVGRRQPA